MTRATVYGWFSAGTFCISHYPPDAPVRPHLQLGSFDEVRAFMKRRRAIVYWWPPLPDHLNAQIKDGIRLEGGDEDLRLLDAAD